MHTSYISLSLCVHQLLASVCCRSSLRRQRWRGAPQLLPPRGVGFPGEPWDPPSGRSPWQWNCRKTGSNWWVVGKTGFELDSGYLKRFNNSKLELGWSVLTHVSWGSQQQETSSMLDRRHCGLITLLIRHCLQHKWRDRVLSCLPST